MADLLTELKSRKYTPQEELAVIQGVAQEYELTPEQTNLLYAIRQAEQGRTGREFGVLNPKAMRYENDPQNSFPTQAKWAAGTIKKRYTGDLEKFRDRWAPLGADNDPKNLNKNWVKNVRFYMDKGIK